MDYKQKILLENTLEHWLIAAVVFTGSFLVFKSIQIFLLRRLNKRHEADSNQLRKLILTMGKSTKSIFLLLVSAYFASDFLELHPRAEHLMVVVTKLSIFLQLGFWGSASISALIGHQTKETMKRDAGRATTLSAVGFLLEISVWILVGLLALNNFGINVSALIAGLGIGGIAIALAVQNLLGDLLASFSIVLDKPFVMGDTISVGDENGTVEHIGLKTTRLRSTNGEQLIFSNSELLKSRIHNFQRMQERLVRFRLHLSYANSAEQLAALQAEIESIIGGIRNARFERCHLIDLNKESASYEIVYSTLSPRYIDYLDIQHRLNLEILSALHKRGLKIAVSAGIPANL